MGDQALNNEDRVMAIVAWGGIFVMGPLVPAVILAMNWRRRESLARRHALWATILNVAILAVWLPLVLPLFLDPFDPNGFDSFARIWLIGLVLTVFGITASAVGFVLALRTPVAAPPPPAAWPPPPPSQPPARWSSPS